MIEKSNIHASSLNETALGPTNKDTKDGKVSKEKPQKKETKKMGMYDVITYMLWGSNLYEFNTVGETQACFNFFVMQLFRLLFFLGLLINTGVLGFIFMKRIFIFINFWGLLLSMIAFGCLFVGSGSQVCEQKLLMKGKNIEKRKLTKVWMWGIFFYNQALPFVISSNVIFWGSYGNIESKFYRIERDLDLMTSVFYTRNAEEFSYRFRAIKLSHILPLVAFAVDMFINKIRIPWHHAIYSVILTVLYFLVTYIGQIISDDVAVYYYDLNWNCAADFTYLQAKNETKNIIFHNETPCDTNDYDTTEFQCLPLYEDYYCNTKNIESQVKYDPFENRDKILISIFALQVVSFFVMALIHHLKAGSVKGFNTIKQLSKIKKKLKQEKNKKQ